VNTRTVTTGVLGLALVGAAAMGWWYVLYNRPPEFCEISGRTIHSKMLTRVRINGQHFYACCPRCPLRLAGQTKQRAELVEVTDFVSGRRLGADAAYYVSGSTMEMCSAPRMKLDEARTPYVRLFDRCGPSLVAFADENKAREFMEQYGGGLKRIDELIEEAASAQPLAGEQQ
jgi:hypothetical protein